MSEKVEVLVAAMNQKDFSLVDAIGLKSPAIIANQCDENRYEQKEYEYGCVKLVSSSTKGVGKNRNIGLLYATGDFLLFLDEDVILYDNYQNIITNAFQEYKKADVICFGIDFTKRGVTYNSRLPKKGRLSYFNALKFGAVGVVIKKESLQRKNICFSELFGGGCLYSHGEDSDFILQCYKKGLHVYSYNKIICKTAKDTSTCFFGYNEKYFYDAGALSRNSFNPLLALAYTVYLSCRIKETKLSVIKKFKLMRLGYKNFVKLIPYKGDTV